MSNRLQVLINEQEYQQIKLCSGQEGQSISQWVRAILQKHLSRRKPVQSNNAIQILKNLNLPAPSIHKMLEEIEAGKK